MLPRETLVRPEPVAAPRHERWDFGELGTLRGFPPKVIWLRLGNCTTAQIEALLRLHFDAVKQLTESEGIGILSLL